MAATTVRKMTDKLNSVSVFVMFFFFQTAIFSYELDCDGSLSSKMLDKFVFFSVSNMCDI